MTIAPWAQCASPSSIRLTAPSRCATRAAATGSATTAKSTTTANCALELEAKGCVFRTRSDTEVLLQGVDQSGASNCLPRLNGGFAFALYDRRTGVLVLARDHFGKRPLFYAEHQGGLLFASEMKAFLAYPGFTFEQDAGQISSILAQWTPLPHQTGFTGIDSLGLGEWLEFRGGTVTRRSYSAIAFDKGPMVRTEADALELIRAALDESVKLRLRSDVDVGVYLSGGLDSSIIALLTTQRAAARRAHLLDRVRGRSPR